MKMPNFLVIGAAKSGTTALYEYLKQHPQIYMSWLKEPHFFAFEGEKPYFRGPGDQELYNYIVVDNLGEYLALFQGASSETAIGEASVNYLYLPRACARIKHYLPEAKLIAVLRDPVERAYSSFLHMTRDGREPLNDFAQALRAEGGRIQDGWAPIWHYKQAGFYHAQLKRYYEAFAREQIRVYLYEDLNNDPVSVLLDIYRFLGVDETFGPDISKRYNVSGVPKNERLHAFYSFLMRPHPIKSAFKPLVPSGLRRRFLERLVNTIRNRNLVKPPLSENVRRQLTEAYRGDILRLQGLIQRDLSGWLQQ
jgi:Sulfotransferase family